MEQIQSINDLTTEQEKTIDGIITLKFYMQKHQKLAPVLEILKIKTIQQMKKLYVQDLIKQGINKNMATTFYQGYRDFIESNFQGDPHYIMYAKAQKKIEIAAIIKTTAKQMINPEEMLVQNIESDQNISTSSENIDEILQPLNIEIPTQKLKNDINQTLFVDDPQSINPPIQIAQQEGEEEEKKNNNQIIEHSTNTKENRIITQIPIKFNNFEEYYNSFNKLIDNEIKMVEQIPKETFVGKFKFDLQRCKHISRRIVISIQNYIRIVETDVLKITMYYSQQSKEPYVGYGMVYKLNILRQIRQTDIVVDITMLSPMDQNHQELPMKNDDLFLPNVEIQICQIENFQKQRFILNLFRSTPEQIQLLTSTSNTRQIILEGKPRKAETSKFPLQFQVDGLSNQFTTEQITAIKNALKERISIIQGPFGTGKTVVLSAIVAHWSQLLNPNQKILVCTPSNYAADLIAEKLSSIPSISQKFIRFYGQRKEDIFNLDLQTLKYYTLQSKVLQDEIKHYYNELTIQDQFIQNIKIQLDWYFGDYNYPTDDFLHSLIESDNYIPISRIIEFSRLKNLLTRVKDVIEASKYSSVFQISEDQLFIRKKERFLNNEFRLLGLDKDGISNLNEQEFKQFIKDKKKIEDVVIQNSQIIVTTCNNCLSNRLKNVKFDHVIIDEATQATELESLFALINCRKAVLIGDQMQLGPIYHGKIEGPESMFTRLILAGYPYVMLQHQHRMHEMILNIPNMLFYNHQIKNSYKYHLKNKFLHKDKPMLFINSNSKEQGFGESYFNKGEASTIIKVLQSLMQKGYKSKDFGFIAPYAGQINIINTKLAEIQLENQAKSIDSWQGREKEFIVFSCVRSNNNNFIGFLENPNRINVALTRAMHGLIIVGNAKCLQKNYYWGEIIKYMKENGMYMENCNSAIQYINSVQNEEQDNQSIFDFM